MKGVYATMADMVNHPAHYNHGSRETIEEMRILFGDEAVKDFCRLSVYKYMSRADYKGKKEQDLQKADWYMTYLDNMHKEQEARWATPSVHDDSWEKILNALLDIKTAIHEIASSPVKSNGEKIYIDSKGNEDKVYIDFEETMEFFKKMAFSELNKYKDTPITNDEYKAKYNECIQRFAQMTNAYIKKLNSFAEESEINNDKE